MCQKSVINSPETAVSEMLEGIGYAYPGLHIKPDEGVVLMDKDRGNKVALVCGSAAGFEPFAAGYVGEGMLTAYISGKMGRAPRAAVILSVIVRLAELNKGGILVLILNYSRDVLNFGLAIERGRCLGLKVEAVVLVDDCSRWKKIREEQCSNLAYKIGVAGSVFAFKILGALSFAGASISRMVSEARNINFRLTTLGFVTEPYCFPGADKPAYTLNPKEVVIGMGINGEHGIKSIEQTSARDVVRAVMSIIYEEARLNSKSGVFVMVNRFSSMTVNEAYVIAKEVYQYLAKKKLSIWRLLVSQFMASYDAKGAHISVLNLSGKDVEWLQLLEMETEAFAWPNTKMSSTDPNWAVDEIIDDFGPEPQPRGGKVLSKYESRIFRKVIESVCKALIDAELVLNQLNANSNGDCGTNLKTFACSVLQKLSSNLDIYRDVSLVFQTMERCAEEDMEGSIGSVYAALLCGASYCTSSWPECFQGAIKFLGTYFPIVRGYRTLFDVIDPACEEFVEHYNLLGEEFWRAALQLAVDKAEKACVETYYMKPKVGLYSIGSRRNMDAGGYSVVVWMQAVNNALKMCLPFDRLPPPEEEDWRHRLQYLLLSLRPVQPVSALKDKLIDSPQKGYSNMPQISLLKDTKECVKDMIQGIVGAYPGLSAFPEQGITFLNKHRGNKVAILSGGGSGHEPFPIGFIADNMITGTVSGSIFTSPPTQHIFTAINILSSLNKGGVLVAVLNYTGDQLNFGLAIERARSKGIEVEKISISDDISLLDTDQAEITGNRGILGCAFVFKLLGAMSEEERSLHEIKNMYQDIINRVASMGACLVPCKLPNSNDFLFELKEDEVSFGCGVHGEAGICTLKMNNLDDMVAQVLEKIYESEIVRPGNKACVLIGNLGSLTSMESFVIANIVQNQLEKKKIRIERMYVGTLMSSLDMKGFQISVLNTTQKETWLRYLDSPTAAFGWTGTWYSNSSHNPVFHSLPDFDTTEEQMEGPKLNEKESNIFKISVIAACNAIKENTEKINELDSGCGDGDCGSTMAYFADAILAQIDSLPWNWVGSCLLQLSKIAEVEMGGTSGAVYSLLLAGAAKGIGRSWEEGWSSALQTLYDHSPARVGHRTLIDALAPACEAYCSCMSSNRKEWKLCLKQAVMAAKTGCHNTSKMKAKVGRAAYAATTMLKSFDAGAFAVTVWLQAIYLSLENY